MDDTSQQNILEQAYKLTTNDRQRTYGHPSEDFARTAKMWEAILGVKVTPIQVAYCMICVKLSRLVNKFKYDSLLDIAGYANCAHMVWQREQEMGPLNED